MFVEMTNEEYHAKKEYISSSNLKALGKSKAHFYESLKPSDPTDSMILGSLTHKLYLEPSKVWDEFAVAPNVDRRTKQGKEDWERFTLENAGKQVVKHEDFQNALQMARNANSAFPVESNLVEKSFFCENMHGIKAKCRPDLLIKKDDGSYTLVDLKTTKDAGSGFERQFYSLGYDVQFAFYTMVLEELGLKVSEWVCVAVDNSAPFQCGVYNITTESIRFAKEKVIDLIDKLKNIDTMPNGYGTFYI